MLPLHHSVVDVVVGGEFDALSGGLGDGALEPRRMAGAKTDSGTLPGGRDEHEVRASQLAELDAEPHGEERKNER